MLVILVPEEVLITEIVLLPGEMLAPSVNSTGPGCSILFCNTGFRNHRSTSSIWSPDPSFSCSPSCSSTCPSIDQSPICSTIQSFKFMTPALRQVRSLLYMVLLSQWLQFWSQQEYYWSQCMWYWSQCMSPLVMCQFLVRSTKVNNSWSH